MYMDSANYFILRQYTPQTPHLCVLVTNHRGDLVLELSRIYINKSQVYIVVLY